MPKKKRTPRQIAKDKAWDTFSVYIRMRDCLKTTGTLTEGECCSCQRRIPFKGSHAGHFIPGRGNAVLFDERGVHLQCPSCNLNPPRGKGGNYHEYWLFMERTYGRKEIDKQLAKKHETVKYSIVDFDAITEKYKKLIDKMK